MSSGSCHLVRISVENLVLNEVVCYPIVLIKGKIECEVKCRETISGSVTLQNGTCKTAFTLTTGRFQGLTWLTPGCNHIQMCFTNDTHIGDSLLKVEYGSFTPKRIVKLVYLLPNDALVDESLIHSNCSKIQLGARIIQLLTAERLHEQGLGRKTFQLSSSCSAVWSSLTRGDLEAKSGPEIWNHTAKKMLEEGIITKNVKVLALLDCPQQVACGRGNLALLGVTDLPKWPENLHQFIGDLQTAKIKYEFLYHYCFYCLWKCYYSHRDYCKQLGAALHELGHSFNLVHSDEGIMSRGFEDVDLFFTNQLSSDSSSSYGKQLAHSNFLQFVIY